MVDDVTSNLPGPLPTSQRRENEEMTRRRRHGQYNEMNPNKTARSAGERIDLRSS
jgi:hypothetical protein